MKKMHPSFASISDVAVAIYPARISFEPEKFVLHTNGKVSPDLTAV